MNTAAAEKQPIPCLEGAGEMAFLTRTFNWSSTPVGTPDTWPASLRITLSTLLHSGFPMLLFWGDELTCFYNDAFKPSLGNKGKHPGILGKPGAVAWQDTWHYVGPLISEVYQNATSVCFEDHLVPIFRNGKMENVYWTFSYSPVKDEAGITQGVLVVCNETTTKVTKFHNVVQQVKTPIVIYKGEDLIIEEANQAALDTWRVGPEVLGKPFLEMIPEMRDQGFAELLLHVYHTGQSFNGMEAPARFARRENGKTETIYFNYEFSPYREANGEISGVMVLATDVTQQVRAKQHLDVAEDEMRVAIDAADLGYWHLNPFTNLFTCNNRTKELFGLPGETDIDLKLVLQRIHPDDQERVKQAINVALQPGSSGRYDIEYRVKKLPEQQTHYVRAIGKTYFNDQQQPYRFSGTVHDITKSKQSEEALKQSNERFELLAMATQDAIWDWNLLNNDTWWSKGFKTLFGYKEEEIEVTIQSWHTRVHPEDKDRVMNSLHRAIDNLEDNWFAQYRFLKADGSYAIVQDRGFLIKDAEGRACRMLGSMQDITDRTQFEYTLKESENRFRGTFENAAVGIAHVSLEGKWLMVNEKLCSILGYAREELLSSTFQQITHPEDLDTDLKLVQQVLAGNLDSYSMEKRFIRKDGSLMWVNLTVSIVRNKEGEPQYFISVMEDISDRKKATAALKISEEKYRSLFETMDQGFCVIELMFDDANQPFDYRFVECNPVFNQQTGLTDAIGKTARELIPGLEERWFQTYGKVALSGDATRFTEGSEAMGRWFEVYAFRLGDEYSRQVAILFSDITERIRAEESLRQSEEQLRLVSDFMPQIVWATDARGKLNFFNKRWYQFTGLNHQQSLENDSAQLLHPEDQERAKKTWQDCLLTGALYETEYRMRRADGQYRWVLARAMPFRNETGAVVKWLGTCTDIHDQKTFAEQLEHLVAERTQALQRSNEDLQQFAHVASHDLKEPLRKIRTFESRLSSDFADLLPDRAKQYLSKMEQATKRMYHMIDGVLVYSSFNPLEHTLTCISLQQVLDDIASDLEIVMEQTGATLHYQQLPEIEGAPTLIHQLFYNLINNALKFSSKERQPVVEVSAQLVTAAEAGIYEVAADRMYARIYIRDNGIGFLQEHAEKIFGTFTRLNSKDQYEGTGLGLALCKKIVDRHEGTISAEAQINVGATFIITLPVQQNRS